MEVDASPLVTVAVISYNSAKTIVETLESIKNQTYKNIELIVSDDCSADNTIEIVKDWFTSNGANFVATKLITVHKNSGVTANCNRAYRAASGEFVKDMGADDLLFPSYLEDCIDFFAKNADAKVLFTKISTFYDTECLTADYFYKTDYSFFEKSASEQFEIIKGEMPVVPSPSVIYRKSLIERLGYFDERIPMCEDAPMYFKISENGEKLFLLDKVDFAVRIRNDSISHANSISYLKSIALFYKFYQWRYEKKHFSLKVAWHVLKSFLFYNSDKKIMKFFLSFFNSIVIFLKGVKNK